MIINKNEIGIRMGGPLDRCFICEAEGKIDSLDYKECFTIKIRGNNYNICMDHLNDLLYPYVLFNPGEIEDE